MNILNVIAILLLLVAFTLSSGGGFNLTLRDWNLHVRKRGKSIDEAIKEYFQTKTFKLSVAIHMEYSKTWQIYMIDYMSDLLKESEYNMKFQIYINDFGGSKNTELYYNNLWYVDSYVGFRSLLPNIKHYMDDKIGRYMVVMETAPKLEPQEELRLIFQYAFELNIYNIVVAVYVGNYRFVLYTYNVFHPGKCRQVIQKQINTFANGKFESKDLFPYKYGNFHKCAINIHVRNAAPYFSYTLARDGKHIDRYVGLEAKIIDTMAEMINFKLRLYYGQGDMTGTVYSNGSSTGPFLLLRNGPLDVVMGYYNSRTRSRFFSCSASYLIAPDVVVFHERSKIIIEGWWLLDAFQKQVWLLIFFVVVVATATVHYVHYKFRKSIRFPLKVTWLDMLGLSLGHARTLKLHYFSTKYASLMWAIGFMILCAIFQGKLCDAFNRKFAPSIDCLKKLIDANTTFILEDTQEMDLVDALKLPHQRIQYREYFRRDDLYEDVRKYPDNAATITNYWQFLSYINRNHHYSEFGMLHSAVVYNQLCAYMRHHSYLNEPITRLFKNLNSGGILTKWIKDTTVYGAYSDIKRMNQQELVPKPLPMVKIRIVFIGMAVMYIASILVFVGEIVFKKLTK